ncbi:MAG: type I restriction enzyme, S subunit [bacterium P3]|nr:MAG: type I restriction enzyme, S subunit [bacterium P3]KWW28449.1 MAG: type I restriction enzyme, S subunit [bacterium F083]
MERQYKESGISWVGKIPESWDVLRNKNTFICGKDLVGEKSSSTQLLSLTTKGIRTIKQGETSGKVPESYDTYQTVNPNNLVMCLFDLDCSAVFAGLSPYCGMISPAYKVLSCKSTMIPQFANYWFTYVFEGRKFMHYSKNIRYSLTYDEFSALKIVVPPLNVQQCIADYLDEKCGEIDSLIGLQEQMIEKLKAYKQSVITETVTKGLNPNARLVPSGIDWIGDVPEGWAIVPLRYLGRTQNGISKSGEYFGEGDPFVSYSDVYKNYSLPSKVTGLVKSTKQDQLLFSVEEGDVFFTRTSETIDEIGFSCVCLNTIEKAVFAGFLIRFRPYKNILNKNFSKYYFRSSVHRAYFVKEMNIVTRASLSQELLKSMPVLLPPFDEQQAIASYLDGKCSEIDNLIAVKQQKIEKLKEYKKSVIYEAVTGKTDLRE